MRLIDADAIPWTVPWTVDGTGMIPITGKDEIDEMPTIDAMPVVRCKNCKHYWRNHADDISVPVCLASPKDDAFCSEGERQ